MLAVPRGHPLAEAKKPVALKDVLGLPLVVMPDVAGTRALEAAGEAAGEALNIVLETDNPEAMRRMVERGLGIAVLPSIMARERDRPRLRGGGGGAGWGAAAGRAAPPGRGLPRRGAPGR